MSLYAALSMSLLSTIYLIIIIILFLLGIFASIAALILNCVRKEDIDYSPYDEGKWR
ncbi:hypothetical protein Gohar_015279 [Gossypium harknessii]|uniref:Uncharacterized protein n=1 Tax=Gossypium harknessii TaxID=34285 RepID=A0A7J9FZE8_9ROSI|nr:hypothetical protein [Gossypium harknessii]